MPSFTLAYVGEDRSTISHHLPGLFFFGMIPIELPLELYTTLDHFLGSLPPPAII